ncbi:IclR family transcriptional regulator [Caulobacter sp. S45]|jgi:IclR family acetate operon transcriptional repressor|uniref:IclR family transcriptional regulator n=1 Tax=Caulobacter sp. S45 TaxID=1641861 RepID=UPI00131BF55B|nr:IclR family transcriptional regulator [Caulobacter sp. S45]
MADESETNTGKQVIARAAAVLRTLENRDSGRTHAQIACDTGLPRTTVQRLVQALEAQQLVSSTADGVRLGPALARLAASAHTDVLTLARPHMEAAARHTRETVHLSVMRGENSILVEQCPSDQMLRVVFRVGAALPMYCTSHGKAMLAQLSDDEIARCFNAPFEARTPRTPVSIAELLTQIEAIRPTGVAESLEEHTEGVCGVGTVIRTGTVDRYALSIGAPTHRFERGREALRATLLRCVSSIEASLGAK